jgi:hypothetical protein
MTEPHFRNRVPRMPSLPRYVTEEIERLGTNGSWTDARAASDQPHVALLAITKMRDELHRRYVDAPAPTGGRWMRGARRGLLGSALQCPHTPPIPNLCRPDSAGAQASVS